MNLEVEAFEGELRDLRKQKEWVSLTDDDILEAIRRNKNKMYLDFAKDIEAVLKEKNGW